MHMDDDPAVVTAPWGDAVDGRRLLREAVGFGRALRAAGLAVDLGAAVDYARALPLVDMGEREQVRAAGEAVFVRRRDDRPAYDAVFDRWWRQRRRRGGDLGAPPLERPGADDAFDGESTGQAEPAAGEQRVESSPDERGIPIPSAGDDDGNDDVDLEGVVVAPDAYSRGEMLRHREFDRMTRRSCVTPSGWSTRWFRGWNNAGPAAMNCTRTAGGSPRARCSARTSGPAGSS